MKLLCIDPGTFVSGMVIFDTEKQLVLEAEPEIKNQELRELIPSARLETDLCLIEMVASYGMPVGAEVFETVVWIGRFLELYGEQWTEKIYRRDVKLELCKSTQAKDSHIRQAILDRFPCSGGGKTPQIGTKGQPGPLYGVSKHALSALALGLTYAAQLEREAYIQQIQEIESDQRKSA